LKYTVDYLTKQLAEASKIRDHHAESLAAHPDDVALQIVARSMATHVAEIKRDLKEAKSAEAKSRKTNLPKVVLIGKTAKKRMKFTASNSSILDAEW